jgi:chlorobactene glucosyltransferase
MAGVWLETYLIAVSIVCLCFLGMSLANMAAFKRLNIPAKTLNSPKVSILIPARDEEHNLRTCLDSLLKQNYSNYEMLVLDDNSSDGTAAIISEYEAKHQCIKGFSGKPLPADWLGKHWACQQLSEIANGEYFLFTDADTIHKPDCVSWALTNMMHHDADFMSAFPRQIIGSFGEAVVVPGMYMITSFFMPVWLIPKTKSAKLSFAIGQFVIGRASVYRAMGGYEQIKSSLVDDISMARNIKTAGFKTLFLDGEDHIECRMYHSYREAFGGLVKNIYAALDKSLARLSGAIFLISAAVILPLFNLVYRVGTGADNILLSALPVAIFLVMWFVSLRDRKVPAYIPFLYPLLFVNILTISVVSAVKTGFGRGALWKGRWVK